MPVNTDVDHSLRRVSPSATRPNYGYSSKTNSKHLPQSVRFEPYRRNSPQRDGDTVILPSVEGADTSPTGHQSFRRGNGLVQFNSQYQLELDPNPRPNPALENLSNNIEIIDLTKNSDQHPAKRRRLETHSSESRVVSRYDGSDQRTGDLVAQDKRYHSLISAPLDRNARLLSNSHADLAQQYPMQPLARLPVEVKPVYRSENQPHLLNFHGLHPQRSFDVLRHPENLRPVPSRREAVSASAPISSLQPRQYQRFASPPRDSEILMGPTGTREAFIRHDRLQKPLPVEPVPVQGRNLTHQGIYDRAPHEAQQHIVELKSDDPNVSHMQSRDFRMSNHGQPVSGSKLRQEPYELVEYIQPARQVTEYIPVDRSTISYRHVPLEVGGMERLHQPLDSHSSAVEVLEPIQTTAYRR